MKREFLDLIKWNKYVAEYKNEFNVLSHFILTLVNTEGKKY